MDPLWVGDINFAAFVLPRRTYSEEAGEMQGAASAGQRGVALLLLLIAIVTATAASAASDKSGCSLLLANGVFNTMTSDAASRNSSLTQTSFHSAAVRSGGLLLPAVQRSVHALVPARHTCVDPAAEGGPAAHTPTRSATAPAPPTPARSAPPRPRSRRPAPRPAAAPALASSASASGSQRPRRSCASTRTGQRASLGGRPGRQTAARAAAPLAAVWPPTLQVAAPLTAMCPLPGRASARSARTRAPPRP